MAAVSMLELQDVSKRYGETIALRTTSLVCARDRTTALIGPSGCGKSTLLRLMVGLIAPDSGSVVFDGEARSAANVRPHRLRMGYVIQSGGLFPHLDARGNVDLMARYLGWTRERIDGRTDELCELTRFPRDALARHPDELSGGQRQRVGLMRALMLDPDVLLLDEPLGALDPMIRAELQEDLRGIFRARKKTVVLVTHDLGEAAFFADTVVLLRGGEIVQQGSVRELLREPAEPFVTAFVRAQRAGADAFEASAEAGEGA